MYDYLASFSSDLDSNYKKIENISVKNVPDKKLIPIVRK